MSATFMEANRARLELKMKLSVYAWYCNSAIITDSDGYAVVITVKSIDNFVRKTVPQVINNVNIKTEAE